jgi:hypothetical protein
MPAFTMRLNEELTAALDSLFPLYGYRSRNHFLEHLAQEAAQRGFVPTRVGEGYRAISPGGGGLSLMRQLDLVASGSRGLTAEETAMYEQAKRLAEQGDWLSARNLLQEAGFKIENVAETPTEPRPVFVS